jgi:hypothetical protein
VNSTRDVRGLTEVTTGTMVRVVDGPRSVGVDPYFNPHDMLSALIGQGPEL